jgi:hypothetical protein
MKPNFERNKMLKGGAVKKILNVKKIIQKTISKLTWANPPDTRPRS